jgi:hypothetical protein
MMRVTDMCLPPENDYTGTLLEIASHLKLTRTAPHRHPHASGP